MLIQITYLTFRFFLLYASTAVRMKIRSAARNSCKMRVETSCIDQSVQNFLASLQQMFTFIFFKLVIKRALHSPKYYIVVYTTVTNTTVMHCNLKYHPDFSALHSYYIL
jgi:hypothetical protein